MVCGWHRSTLIHAISSFQNVKTKGRVVFGEYDGAPMLQMWPIFKVDNFYPDTHVEAVDSKNQAGILLWHSTRVEAVGLKNPGWNYTLAFYQCKSCWLKKPGWNSTLAFYQSSKWKSTYLFNVGFNHRHVVDLHSGLLDNWQRCKQLTTASSLYSIILKHHMEHLKENFTIHFNN